MTEDTYDTWQLADAIVLEVGYRHWNRMNAPRLGWPDMNRKAFMDDMDTRVPRYRLLDYLTERLTAERLALPTGYVYGTNRKLSTDGA